MWATDYNLNGPIFQQKAGKNINQIANEEDEANLVQG